jgi:hypothetical protein
VVLENDVEYQLDRSCEKLIGITCSEGGHEYHTYSKKRGRFLDCTNLGYELPSKHAIEEKIEEMIQLRQDNEEDVSSYWMILRKREDTGILKRKHQSELSGELNLEQSMDLL